MIIVLSVLLAWLETTQADVPLRMPSSAFFDRSLLDRHPAASVAWTGDSLYHAYGRSIANQLDSLSAVLTGGEDFHFDAITVGLNSTGTILQALGDGLRKIPSGEPGGLTAADYSILIRETQRMTNKGINPIHSNELALKQRAREFRDYFNIIYVEDIFDSATFEKLERETRRLWGSTDIEPNCNLNGVDRLGGYIHHSVKRPLHDQLDSLYSLIYGNEPLRLWMSAITETPVFPADFPIELREYGPNSQGMACHADVQMYADLNKNFETVVTISNNGDCEVSWFDREGTRHVVKPKPNSITIVQPNSAVHCVTGTGGGEREMLKFIMVGDYRKHPDFYRYIDNVCSSTNPNVLKLHERQLAVRSADDNHNEL